MLLSSAVRPEVDGAQFHQKVAIEMRLSAPRDKSSVLQHRDWLSTSSACPIGGGSLLCHRGRPKTLPATRARDIGPHTAPEDTSTSPNPITRMDTNTPQYRRQHRATIEEHIRVEEKKIHDALGQIRRFQTERNRTVPIASLPPELLAVTFLLVRDASQDLEWLPSLLHTCTAWRAHAIGFPSLWSRIKVRELETTKLLLERSVSVPLSMFLVLKPRDSVQSGHLQAIDLGMAEIARIRHLQVVFHELSQESERLKFIEYFQCPAPLLETFTVQARNFMGRQTLFPLPHHLFDDKLPFLKSLEYLNCDHSPSVALLLNLRKLAVCFDDGLPTRVSPHSFSEVLNNLPLLEDLVFQRAIPSQLRGPDDLSPGPEDGPHAGHLFELPRLKRLYLEDDLLPSQRFLQRLLPPPSGVTRSLDVHCYADPHEDDVTLAIAAFSRHTTAGLRGARIAFANGHQHSRLHLQLFQSAALPSKATPAHTQLVIAFTGLPYDPALAPAVLAASAHLPLGAVEHAHIEYIHPLKRDEWARLLEAFPKLCFLSSAESPAIRLISSIADEAAGVYRPGASEPVLPSLARITIDRVSLKTIYPCTTSQKPFAFDLRRLVQARARRGHPLAELVLQRVRDAPPEMCEILADVDDTVKFEHERVETLYADDYRLASPLDNAVGGV